MTIKNVTATLILAAFSFSAFADAVADRAAHFNQLFFDKVPANYLDVNIQHGIARTRNVLTVIPGVLYRGGGEHGQHPLTSDALMDLCVKGFSLAVYAYETEYRDPGVIRCTTKDGHANSLRYIAGSANTDGFKETFLREVQTVISNPALGPVFEHCWNGDHASGELAAVALRQFCKMDVPTVNAYWLRHGAGAPLIKRIGKFSPIGGLSIPDNEMDVLCSQKK